MSGYLPLCASRQERLPPDCRACTWWQTPTNGRQRAADAAETRRQWMLSVGSAWGSPGLLQEGGARTRWTSLGPAGAAVKGHTVLSSRNLAPVTCIHYAPAATIPRLSSLPFVPPGHEAVLVFCLRSEEDQAGVQARRMLHRALGQLKDRGVQEVYAFAGLVGSPEDQGRCQFFSLEFLESNGFQQVADNGDIYLMRADLRGLLSLVNQMESLVRRVLRHDPTPSPATWTQRGPS